MFIVRVFSDVEADLTGKDGAWYNMNAPVGYLDSDAQKLWLARQTRALLRLRIRTPHRCCLCRSGAELRSKNRKARANKAVKRGKPAPRCAKNHHSR